MQLDDPDPILRDRAVGELIGARYRLSRCVRQGKVGQVFEAEDSQLFQQIVAIKLLNLSQIKDPALEEQLRQQFEEEAQVSVLLGGHPNIIRVRDYGTDQGQPYLVMDYLGTYPPHGDLNQLLQQEGPFLPRRILGWMRQICSGLHHAHQFVHRLGRRQIQGVVHCDVKLSNLFVARHPSLGETITILDFGIASSLNRTWRRGHSRRQLFFGSPRYASPEQLLGSPLDRRSDIYSLGVVLFQLLTGELPLTPETRDLQGWARAHLYQAPKGFRETRFPTLSADLETVIRSCLEKDPDHRPANMEILTSLLEAALDPLVPQPEPNPGDPEQPVWPPQAHLHLDPQVHQAFETLLASYFGPIAPLLLHRSLQKVLSAEALIDLLCDSLPPDHQDPFQHSAESILMPPADVAPTDTSVAALETTAPYTAPYYVTPAPQPRRIPNGFVERCEQELAQVIGPIAALLVQQTLRDQPEVTADQLLQELRSWLQSMPEQTLALEERLTQVLEDLAQQEIE